jgi:hypothetical protein
MISPILNASQPENPAAPEGAADTGIDGVQVEEVQS